MKTPPWLAYVGTVLAALAFMWSLASAWFELKQRIALLEQQQRYSHGDLSPFLEEK